MPGQGQRPCGTGQRPALGEPTTTEAKRVVIVGYNKASLVVFPANPFACAYFFIPPSIRSISAGFCSLQLAAAQLLMLFQGTTTVQIIVQIVVRPIVDGLV